jgi:hypothetical protein
MKTPLEKATTVIDIVDASVDLLTPIATLVIVDEARLEREVLKGSIADENVQKLLPFNTVLVAGSNYFHLQNASAYNVETNSHRIYEGDTLCAKVGPVQRLYSSDRAATCPGCLAKGKAIIVNHLLSLE